MASTGSDGGTPDERTLESARLAVQAARRGRQERRANLERARLVRRRSRALRDHAVVECERTLELKWALWSLGVRIDTPGHVPLDWSETARPEAAIAEAARAAETFAAACYIGFGAAAEHDQRLYRLLAAVGSVTAECAELEGQEATDVLSLCARVIQTNCERLDEAASSRDGLLVASAARRCAQACTRALIAIYAAER